MFAKTPCTQTEGHLRDAIVARRPGHFGAVRRPESRVVCGAGACDAPGAALRSGRSGRAAPERERRGRREPAAEDPRDRGQHDRRGGLHRGPGRAAPRRYDRAVRRDPGPVQLGSFLRGFTWGNVRQLEVVSRRLLAQLAATTPVLADAPVFAHLDIDSTPRRVYSHATQGAGFGAAKVGGYTLRLRGLNPLLARCPRRRAHRYWSAPGCAAGPRTPRAAPPPSSPRRSPPPAPPGPPGC